MKPEVLIAMAVLIALLLAVWASIATCDGVLVRGLLWFQCIPWRTLG